MSGAARGADDVNEPQELTAGGSLPAVRHGHAMRQPHRRCLHDPVAEWISRREMASAGTEVAGESPPAT